MISSWFANNNKKEQKKESVIKIDRRLIEGNVSVVNSQIGKQNKKYDNIDTIISIILKRLEIKIANELGEQSELPPNIQQQLKSQITELVTKQTVIQSEHMQRLLVDNKQKYNELVDSISNNRVKLKEYQQNLAASLLSFIDTINESLQTDVFESCKKELKKAIIEMAAQNFDKYTKLMGKLFQHQFQQKVNKEIERIKGMSDDQAKGYKNSIKGLEIQVVNLKEIKKNQEKAINDLNENKRQLTQRLKEAQKSIKLAQQLTNQLNKEKQQNMEKQLTNKIKELQQRHIQKDQSIKELKQTISMLNERLKSLEKLNQQLKQDWTTQLQKQQQKYLQIIKRNNHDKFAVQQKYSELKIQHQKLQNEQQIQLKAHLKASVQQSLQLQNKVIWLESQVSRLNQELKASVEGKDKLIDKNVVKSMLQVYMDEGKDWHIKAEIQKKLFLMLDIKGKVEEPEQKRGWFGLF